MPVRSVFNDTREVFGRGACGTGDFSKNDILLITLLRNLVAGYRTAVYGGGRTTREVLAGVKVALSDEVFMQAVAGEVQVDDIERTVTPVVTRTRAS